MPAGVPTSTAVSPAWEPKLGVGAGKAVWSRSTATMETPVRLRAWVSAIVPSAYGERFPMVSHEIASPSICLLELGQAADEAGGAQQVGQGVGLLSGEPDHLLAGIEVVGVIQQQVTSAGAVGHDSEVAAGAGGEFVAYPDARQCRLLNVHRLPLVLFMDPLSRGSGGVGGWELGRWLALGSDQPCPVAQAVLEVALDLQQHGGVLSSG
jgi:hypothetical protein